MRDPFKKKFSLEINYFKKDLLKLLCDNHPKQPPIWFPEIARSSRDAKSKLCFDLINSMWTICIHHS